MPTPAFSLNDSPKNNIRPALIVISGNDYGAYRPATADDFGGQTSSAGTATRTSAQATGGSVTLIAGNVNRKGLEIFNNVNSGCDLYLSYISPASSSGLFDVVHTSGKYIMPAYHYTGSLFGVWNMQVPFVNIGSGLIIELT